MIKHRLKAIQKPIKNELGNREKNTKNAHFVLKKCTFRFRDYSTVIFVNGCFWHGHEGCKYFVLPKSRTVFWQAKIERNRERDLEEQRKLAEMGWHCITVWECQLKPKVRENTLQSLEYTLCHIYLEDHKVKRYEMREEERVMAAEPDVEKK